MKIRQALLLLLLSTASSHAFGQTQTPEAATQTQDSAAQAVPVDQAVATSASQSETSSSSAEPAQAPSAPSNNASSSKTVAYTFRSEAPNMLVLTPTNAQFGLLSGVIMAEEGKKVVATYNLQNPANEIAQKFAAQFANENELALGQTAITASQATKDFKAATSAQGISANYVIDATTAGINLTYFPFDWGHYDITLADAIKVIDVDTGKVVLQTKCFIPANKAATPLHTRDELQANEGSLLKEVIGKKIDECVAQMVTKSKEKFHIAK